MKTDETKIIKWVLIEHICWAVGSCVVSGIAFFVTGSFWSLMPMVIAAFAGSAYKRRKF